MTYSSHDIIPGVKNENTKGSRSWKVPNSSKLFIGIDVHKRQWHIIINTSVIHHRTFGQPPDPKALSLIEYRDGFYQRYALSGARGHIPRNFFGFLDV